ncbi:MAG: glutathione S-transferase family protein [Pseudomonadales bacterium]
MMEIKLYGYATSPFVRKTACFLYYKGLAFTHVPVNPLKPETTLAHTHGTQVPVLEIDGEHRRESSDHAHWLDDLFPDKPLCPAANAQRIRAIDGWISDTYLRGMFRTDGAMDLNFRLRAWRLAALVNAHTPLSSEAQQRWPTLLKTMPFIVEMAKGIDMSESQNDMRQRIFAELVGHLGSGPYIGELEQPSMLDLAIFPQIIFGYMFGLEESLSAAQHPSIKQWLQRVAQHLPANPTLIAEHMQVNALADRLS